MRFLGGTERRLRTSWGTPRPSKSTGVHPANFSWAWSAIWAFLPAGSDVCMMLRTVCVAKCLFGTPYPSSSRDLWQFFLLVCECVLFVWLVFLSFVKWKIQVQFIRKMLAMKLWLKKKDFLNTGWPSSVLQTPKKIGYDESLLFLHMQLEKTYFFFLFTILTLRETKICLGESLKLTLVLEIQTQLTLRLQTWVI